MSAPYYKVAERWAVNGRPLRHHSMLHTKDDPDRIYSYGYHYLIGRIDRKATPPTVYLNCTPSTPTTEGQKYDCRRAAHRAGLLIVLVPDPDKTEYQNLEMLFEQLTAVTLQVKTNVPDKYRLQHALELYSNLRTHINTRVNACEQHYTHICNAIDARHRRLEEVYMPNLIRDLARWKAGKRKDRRDGFRDLPIEMRVISFDPLVFESSKPHGGWRKCEFTVEDLLTGDHPFSQEQLSEVNNENL